MTSSPNERGRPVGERDTLTDQSAAKLNDRTDSTADRLTLDPSSYLLLCPSDEADLEDDRLEFPSRLRLWDSPEDCANDLYDTFGKGYARRVAVALRDRLRKGGVR